MDGFAFRDDDWGSSLREGEKNRDYADENYRKSKWHYDRAGVVTKQGKLAKRRPGSFAKAAVYDYRRQLAKAGIRLED